MMTFIMGLVLGFPVGAALIVGISFFMLRGMDKHLKVPQEKK